MNRGVNVLLLITIVFVGGILIFNVSKLTGNVISSGEANSLRQGLVSDWEGGDLDGSFVVDSYGVNQGLNGGASVNGSGENKSYYFNSSQGDYLEIPGDGQLTLSDGFTYEIWVNFETLNPTSQLLHKSKTYAYSSQYSLNVGSDGRISGYVGSNDSGQSFGRRSSTGLIQPDTLYHIIFTWDGYPQYDHVKIYVNNVSVGTSSYGNTSLQPSGPRFSGGRLNIGRAVTTGNPMSGNIYSVRMWNRSLNSSEVNLLWNDGNRLTQNDLGIAPHGFSSRTFYVSSSGGNDSNFGLSQDSPIKTLAHVDVLEFVPGDSILFKRGDSWDGNITITTSGLQGYQIKYGPYGTGENPLIYGSVPISGWSVYSGNIYQADLSEDITQLFLGGERMKLARYPNSGYFYPSSVASTTQFTSTNLSSSINYTGAIWAGRTLAYNIYYKNVTSSSSQTITIDSAPSGSIDTPKGFILMNKLVFLDSPGEWYYDSLTGKLYFWTPNGDSPTNYEVRGTTESYCLYSDSKDYISVENMSFTDCGDTGVYFTASDYINIDGGVSNNSGKAGISGGGGPYNITNSKIYNPASLGIAVWAGGSNITYNEIYNNMAFDSLGLKEPWYVSGITLPGPSAWNVISYNKIINSGYIGIGFSGENSTVSYNYIDNATSVLDDGGGIYAWSGSYSDPDIAGSVIEKNIVLNTHGNRIGQRTKYDMGTGIYMDNAIHDVLIRNNFVYNSSGGILLNSGDGRNTVVNNTVVDAGLLMAVNPQTESSTVINNIFYTTNRLTDGIWWTNSSQRLIRVDNATPVLYGNNYFDHYGGNSNFNLNPVQYNFTGWKAATGESENSTFDNSTLPAGWSEKIIYNDDFSASEIIKFNGNTYQDIYGNDLAGSIILEPFTSTIILGSNLDAITTSLNSCGDSVKADSEECDSGSNNGVVPTPSCGVTISYCSSLCKSVSVTGSSCDSSGSGGSSSVSSASTSASSSDTSKESSGTTYTASDEELKKGFTKTFGVEDVVETNSSFGKVTFNTISSKGIELNIGSNISDSFVIGDVKEFDTDNDGYYDLKVSFNSLEGDKASVTITKIDGEKVNVSPENNLENSTSINIGDNKNTGKFAYLIILFTIFILIIVLVIIYVRHRNSLSRYNFRE